MNQRAMIYAKWKAGRSRAWPMLLLAASMLFTSCGLSGGGETVSSGAELQLPPQSQASLTCSQECSDRGWCGLTADQRAVVLGNGVDPMAETHDRLFLQDTPVVIEISNIATFQLIASGETFQLPFYLVTSLDQGKSAWVPGWCVAGP